MESGSDTPGPIRRPLGHRRQEGAGGLVQRQAPAPRRRTPLNRIVVGGAAVDLELKAYLDARFTETQKAMDTRFAETQKAIDAMDGKIDETRTTMEAKIDETRTTLEAKIDETRREAGVMFESILHEIRALPEGLSTFQRQEANRLDAEREEAMLNGHVLPLEASAANHEKRINAMEQRR